jgi:hypothetical protein
MRATSNPNSLSTINKSAKNTTRDISGLNFIDLSATSSYHISAAGLNTINTNTSQALLKFGNRALAVSDFSSTGSYTIVIKHAASQSSLPPFNFLYPNVVKLSSAYTAINQDFSAQFYSSLSPGTVIPYSITGIASSGLNNADISGTFTAPYQVISYRVTTAPTTESVFFNVSGGLSTAYYTYDPTVLSVNGLVSIQNTTDKVVSAAYTQNSGLANNVNATYGLQFQGSNYIIYGTNNVSQIALGTRPFFISSTLRFNTSVVDQFIWSTSKEGSRHGLVVHYNGSFLRVQMYNSAGQNNEHAYSATINVDYTLTIERTATSYICKVNGNSMTSSGVLAANFAGAVDCGSSAIRLGGMTFSTNGSAATGNNNGYLWSGYIKNFLLRF